MSLAYRGPAPTGVTTAEVNALIATSADAGANPHFTFAPGAVDYVLDEVQATPFAVAVYDNAAAATLLNDSTVVGPNAAASGIRSVAVGSGAAAAEDATAVGRNSSADSDGTALGAGAYSESGGTAVGFGADASGTEGTALGRASQTTGTAGTAVGYSAVAADGGVALGTAANAGAAGVAILGVADAGAIAIRGTGGTNAVAIGQGSSALSACVSIGISASSAGGNSAALGTHANASGVRSLALGGGTATGATAAGTNAIALGELSSAGANDSIAVGRSASAAGVDAVAIGDGASAVGTRALALGQGASAAAADSVAICSGYVVGSNTGAKHLSPSATGGVALGVSLASQYWSAAYVDAVYPRTRAFDFMRVVLNANGAQFSTTSSAGVLFPGTANFQLGTVTAAAGTQFVNSTSGAIFSISRPSQPYALNVLITLEVPYNNTDNNDRVAIYRIITSPNSDLTSPSNIGWTEYGPRTRNADIFSMNTTRFYTFPAGQTIFVGAQFGILNGNTLFVNPATAGTFACALRIQAF